MCGINVVGGGGGGNPEGNVSGKQSLNSSKTSSTCCRLEASVSMDGFDAEMDSGSVGSTHQKKPSHPRRRSLTALFPEMKRSEAVSVLESGRGSGRL